VNPSSDVVKIPDRSPKSRTTTSRIEPQGRRRPDLAAIVARLDELQAQVDGLNKHQVRTAEELDALLPAVLDRAFRGQL